MTKQTVAAAIAPAPAAAMERLWVLWSGFHDGVEYAHRHPTANLYLDADRVVNAAAAACERQHAIALLDRTIVHPAYTYGWMAGYLATQREQIDAGDESSRETAGAQLRNIISLPR